LQALRKAGSGRPPGTVGNAWSVDEVKKVEDWLVGLGPGRTEELKLNVRFFSTRCLLERCQH
jgi:hypothetical protein